MPADEDSMASAIKWVMKAYKAALTNQKPLNLSSHGAEWFMLVKCGVRMTSGLRLLIASENAPAPALLPRKNPFFFLVVLGHSHMFASAEQV